MGQVAPGSVVLVESVADAEAVEVPDPGRLAYPPRPRCRSPTPPPSSRCCGAASRRSRGRATRTSATPPPTASARWPRSRRAPSCSWWWVPPTPPTRCGWSRSPAPRAARAPTDRTTAAEHRLGLARRRATLGLSRRRLGTGAAGRARWSPPAASASRHGREVRRSRRTCLRAPMRDGDLPLAADPAGAPGILSRWPSTPMAVRRADGVAACLPRRVRAGRAGRARTASPKGVENSNFRLLTERGRYILTIYEKRVDPADLPFFLGLIEHLPATACPARCRSTPATARRCASCGQARRHRQLPRGPLAAADRGGALRRPGRGAGGAAPGRRRISRLPRQRALVRRLAGPVRRPAAATPTRCEPGLEAEIAAELDGARARLAQRSAGGVIHADLFPDNVFFAGERVTGIIDFYFACNDLLAYDVAICLNAWCFEPDGSFNVTKARPAAAGLSPPARRSPAEVAALPVLARGSALRFLLTRLLRLAAPGRGRQGDAQGPARVSAASCASTAASPAPAPTVC